MYEFGQCYELVCSGGKVSDAYSRVTLLIVHGTMHATTARRALIYILVQRLLACCSLVPVAATSRAASSAHTHAVHNDAVAERATLAGGSKHAKRHTPNAGKRAHGNVSFVFMMADDMGAGDPGYAGK